MTYTLDLTIVPTVTPTFAQLGPYFQGAVPASLQGTSLNGITGTWNPAVISTATVGTTVYTFTPNGGQCANPTSMSVLVNAPVSVWTWSQDIGTTLMVAWPATPGATLYAIQYRLLGNTSWIGTPSTVNYAKINNLTAGATYQWRIRSYGPGFNLTSGIQTYTTTVVNYDKAYDIGTTCQITWNDFAPWASSYAFLYKKVGTPLWMGSVQYSSEIKLANLTPETAYECKVIVYKGGNLWGITQIGTFTTGKVNFVVTNNTGTSLDLTWTQSVPDAGPWVTYYAFHYKAQSSSTWIQNPSSTNTYHLTGLTAATAYDCKAIYYMGPVWGAATGTFNTGVVKGVDSENSNSISIYPNPFVDKVNVDLFVNEETNVSWNIYDMTGKVVLSGSESVTTGYTTLNIEAANLPKGVYMLNAIMNNEMQSFRILKQ